MARYEGLTTIEAMIVGAGAEIYGSIALQHVEAFMQRFPIVRKFGHSIGVRR